MPFESAVRIHQGRRRRLKRRLFPHSCRESTGQMRQDCSTPPWLQPCMRRPSTRDSCKLVPTEGDNYQTIRPSGSPCSTSSNHPARGRTSEVFTRKNRRNRIRVVQQMADLGFHLLHQDRKSTPLNSSHVS